MGKLQQLADNSLGLANKVICESNLPRQLDKSWLFDPLLQSLLDVLNDNAERALIVGGAVRNMLWGYKVGDIDIATTALPEKTISLLAPLGKVLTQAQQFGTISLVIKGRKFEITSLRQDIKSDGRHPEVVFGKDWLSDAKRRDFTVNAFYMDKDGAIFDILGNIADIKNHRIAFIGEAGARIREDYLRILRFFRFFAHYSDSQLDAEALSAIATYGHKLKQISKERINGELLTLLKAANPLPALRLMARLDILIVLAGSYNENYEFLLTRLMQCEREQNWPIDALLRLYSLLPDDKELAWQAASRLLLRSRDLQNIKLFLQFKDAMAKSKIYDYKEHAYNHGAYSAALLAKWHIISAPLSEQKSLIALYSSFIADHSHWQKPNFPISGQDLLAYGYKQGPLLGKKLLELRRAWIASNFTLTRQDLLSLLV